MIDFPRLAAVIALVLTSGCASVADKPDDFLTRLGALCGKAFAGRIVSAPVAADAAFAGRPLVMHVRNCSGYAVRVPFHVGDDRSRTWVITRTEQGLRLKHDHRHEDGSADKVTLYGGDSTTPVAVERQEFPADAFTKELLRREGNVAGMENVWALELKPGVFAYELRRPNRHFRVEFDLTRPVAPPPPPWGSD